MQEISEAMAALTADSSTNASETLSHENSSSFRGDSFSSYSNEAEDTFVLQLAQSSRHLNSSPAILNEHEHKHQHVQSGRKKKEYGEVEVFSAEKYFNVMDEEMPKVVNSKYDHLEIGSLRTKALPGTASIRSEPRWNSRISLLHISRNQQHSRKVNNSRAWSFLASLGCNCSCNDKESVNVDNYISGGKAKATPQNGNLSDSKKSYSNTSPRKHRQRKRSVEPGRLLNTPDGISFPVFDSKTGIANKLHLQREEEECTKRRSLEVFGSPIMTKGDKYFSPGRQIARLAWDAIRSREVELTDIPASSNKKWNDTDSDASSDLFEIECFSTNANPNFAWPTSDGMSSCITPTTRYATIEAGLELHTVKASNAPDASVISNTKELMATASKSSHINVVDKEI